jgi:hypothetical protein
MDLEFSGARNQSFSMPIELDASDASMPKFRYIDDNSFHFAPLIGQNGISWTAAETPLPSTSPASSTVTASTTTDSGTSTTSARAATATPTGAAGHGHSRVRNGQICGAVAAQALLAMAPLLLG